MVFLKIKKKMICKAYQLNQWSYGFEFFLLTTLLLEASCFEGLLNIGDRKSTSGYVFLFGNAAISWKSSKQTCIALSTAEAEYVTLSTAAQETIWLRQLMNDLMNKNITEILIFEDNQSTICLARNQQEHGRTKDIDICLWFGRSWEDKSDIAIVLLRIW